MDQPLGSVAKKKINGAHIFMMYIGV